MVPKTRELVQFILIRVLITPQTHMLILMWRRSLLSKKAESHLVSQEEADIRGS